MSTVDSAAVITRSNLMNCSRLTTKSPRTGICEKITPIHAACLLAEINSNLNNQI